MSAEEKFEKENLRAKILTHSNERLMAKFVKKLGLAKNWILARRASDEKAF